MKTSWHKGKGADHQQQKDRWPDPEGAHRVEEVHLPEPSPAVSPERMQVCSKAVSVRWLQVQCLSGCEPRDRLNKIEFPRAGAVADAGNEKLRAGYCEQRVADVERNWRYYEHYQGADPAVGRDSVIGMR